MVCGVMVDASAPTVKRDTSNGGVWLGSMNTRHVDSVATPLVCKDV